MKRIINVMLAIFLPSVGFAEIPQAEKIWSAFHNKDFELCLQYSNEGLISDSIEFEELIYLMLIKHICYKELGEGKAAYQWLEIAKDFTKCKYCEAPNYNLADKLRERTDHVDFIDPRLGFELDILKIKHEQKEREKKWKETHEFQYTHEAEALLPSKNSHEFKRY